MNGDISRNVVFDLDGVLSIDEWRAKIIRPKQEDSDKQIDWEKYHSEAKHDLPNEKMIDLLDCFVDLCFNVIIITGRPYKYRKLAMEWLEENEVRNFSLLMRPDNEFSFSIQYAKAKILFQAGFNKDNVLFVFLKDKWVIEYFRSLGYLVFDIGE